MYLHNILSKLILLHLLLINKYIADSLSKAGLKVGRFQDHSIQDHFTSASISYFAYTVKLQHKACRRNCDYLKPFQLLYQPSSHMTS